MQNGRDQKMQCEIKTDLTLLLECLKYQMDQPDSQKEAMVTIYSICQQNSEATNYFRQIGGLTFVYSLAKSSVHNMIKEAALFTLGGLAESNVFCQQMLCTSGVFEDIHGFLTNEESTVNLKRMSVYVLLVLVSNNKSGQMFVRESGCLDVLLQLFRTVFSTSDVNLLDQNINRYNLWSSICSALCTCVNNPQNEDNQKTCSLLFPHAKDWLQSCTKTETVRPLCSLIGLTVANNSRIQHLFASTGGLAVLDQLLAKLMYNSYGNYSRTKLAITVAKTVDACIADNPAVGSYLSKYNIISNLLTLLSYDCLDSGEKFSIILTLGHCTDSCEENQYILVKNSGLPLIIQSLTESQDEEINKAAIFVLQNCKQITETLSLRLGEHSLKGDRDDQLTVNLQSKKQMREDYWDKAKEFLYKIEKLEMEHQEGRYTNTEVVEMKSSHEKQCPLEEKDQKSETLCKHPYFKIKNTTQEIQNSEPLCLNKEINCTLSTTVNRKIAELRCPGCITTGLSLNSRNFSRILQSCQYLCEHHRVILEMEMEYKTKMKMSTVSIRSSSTGCEADLQAKLNIQLHDHSIKQKSNPNNQDPSENYTACIESENPEIQSLDILTSKSKRRVRKDFTFEEIKYLLAGVEKMGHHWNTILWAYPFQKGRTNVDLAKKYYRLQKQQKQDSSVLFAYSTSPSSDWKLGTSTSILRMRGKQPLPRLSNRSESILSSKSEARERLSPTSWQNML